MVMVKYLSPAVIRVNGEGLLKKEGIIIHGYGGNKEEMLGLAVNLAREGVGFLVFDLPGHGSLNNEVFNLKNSLNRLNNVVSCYFSKDYKAQLKKIDFFIGHSIGARLGLISGIGRGILLSMPGDAFFEGSRQEMMRVLRIRRVFEEQPFSGLKEILSVNVKPKENIVIFRAEQELNSVINLYEDWQVKGVLCHKVKNSNHLDIVSSPYLFKEALKWIKELK